MKDQAAQNTLNRLDDRVVSKKIEMSGFVANKLSALEYNEIRFYYHIMQVFRAVQDSYLAI